MKDPKTLLLVDDDELVVFLLQSVLEEAGYELKICATVFDALNYLEMEPQIDCLLTDIVLSDGSDGWQLAEYVREGFPDMPVLYITGERAADHCFRGVDHSLILEKPFGPAALLGALSHVMRRRPTDPARRPESGGLRASAA